jgi:hypothetical protein
MGNTFDGPFPANVNEADRFKQPKPDHYDEEKKMSGDLPDQPEGNPVRGEFMARWTPSEADTGAPIKNLRSR